MTKKQSKKTTQIKSQVEQTPTFRTEEEIIGDILGEANKLAHGKITGIKPLVDYALELEKVQAQSEAKCVNGN